MCLLCRKEYNEKTTEIKCCNSVTEIPLLPNLIELDCSRTNVTEIPLLPNLTFLNCWDTKITEIPLLPNLTYLNCSNTKITEIPLLSKLNMHYGHCLWLKQWYVDNGNLNTFILLEDKIKFLQKQYQKKKWNKIQKKIPLIRDIKNIILNLLWRFNANPYASERRWDL